jgi:glucosamine-6-phosphate deaminase
VSEPIIHVAADPVAAGAAAARVAAAALRTAIAEHGAARLLLASAPSQESMLAALVAADSVDWSRVHAFHMDEYVGLPVAHPLSFGQWLADRLATVPLGRFDRICPGADPAAEITRYAGLLPAGGFDLTCLGIGMNGHLAFNEPGARFDDPEPVRLVGLDQESRRQQGHEGLFDTLDDVPTHAVTLTVPAVLRARTVVATVLGSHKAEAVADAVEGPLDPACPGSALRTHPAVSMHLDPAAAAKLSG